MSERFFFDATSGEFAVANLLPGRHDIPGGVSVVLQRRRVSGWTCHHSYRPACLPRTSQLDKQAASLSEIDR